MPKSSRLPKSLFPPPSRGPYVVDSQPNQFNLILRDPETDQLVDKGAQIPLDQIVVGNHRARLQFADDEEGDVRPMSVLLDGNRDARGDLSFGYLAGRRKGWGPL